MVISSRTPEGVPNRCPVCRGDVRISASLPFGDAPCPNCGCLLWFVGLPDEQLLFEYEAAEVIRERILERLSQELGVSKHKLEADPSLLKHRLDSLDEVELLMEIEDELGIHWDDSGERR